MGLVAPVHDVIGAIHCIGSLGSGLWKAASGCRRQGCCSAGAVHLCGMTGANGLNTSISDVSGMDNRNAVSV